MARLAALLFAAAASLGSAQDARPDKASWDAQQASTAAAADAKVAKDKKGGAVAKAVELLKSLQTKVMEEGEAEAKTYDKFACFCKDTTGEKVTNIQTGEDEKAALLASIGELDTKRAELDTKIQVTLAEIAKVEMDMESATQKRKEDLALYQSNSEDMKNALAALEGAIKMLKASKQAPSFAQLQGMVQTLQQATLLADALGLTAGLDSKTLGLLQQAPANEVQMEDYNFHSGGVITMLEKLLTMFRTERDDLDKIEASSLHEYNMYMQEKNTGPLKHTLELIGQERSQTIADKEASNQRLTTVAAMLMDDKEYVNKLSQLCADKAKTWDQRSKVRAAEIQVLTQAIGIISGVVSEKTSASTIRFAQQGVSLRIAKALASSPMAMAAIEAEAEAADEAAPSFLQGRAALSSGRRLRGKPAADTEAGKFVIVNLLKSRGQQLKSILLTSLASQIAADPLAKVKTLIQELIERLLQEAGNESNQKGWCDKSMSEAMQKRGYAADEVRRLNSEMANLEAVRDQLTQELGDLAREMQELKDNREKAQAERDVESKQNQATTEEAQQGLDALNMCIDLLDKFYKTMGKEKVDLSLVQAGPEDDAPDAGFDNGEAYMGGQAESGGILAMLEVMRSDFKRSIEETAKAEAQAKQDHLEFMTETGMSLAGKESANSAKMSQLDDAKARLDEATTNLGTQTMLLQSTITQLIELQPVCINTGMSYEDRVAMREEEMVALNKAMCILEHYAEYGPDGAASAC